MCSILNDVRFSEAEKALWRANRAQERYSNISGVDPAIDLEVDIMSTMGRYVHGPIRSSVLSFVGMNLLV